LAVRSPSRSGNPVFFFLRPRPFVWYRLSGYCPLYSFPIACHRLFFLMWLGPPFFGSFRPVSPIWYPHFHFPLVFLYPSFSPICCCLVTLSLPLRPLSRIGRSFRQCIFSATVSVPIRLCRSPRFSFFAPLPNPRCFATSRSVLSYYNFPPPREQLFSSSTRFWFFLSDFIRTFLYSAFRCYPCSAVRLFQVISLFFLFFLPVCPCPFFTLFVHPVFFLCRSFDLTGPFAVSPVFFPLLTLFCPRQPGDFSSAFFLSFGPSFDDVLSLSLFPVTCFPFSIFYPPIQGAAL